MSAACTSLPGAGAGAEHIIEVASGRHISRAELLAAARTSDYVLLGELHDNALHPHGAANCWPSWVRWAGNLRWWPNTCRAVGA